MAYEQYCAIRSLAITAVGWTDILGASIPINCCTVVIFNNSGQDVFLRTDPANANSQVTIQTGQQYELGGTPPPASGSRFPAQTQHPVAALMASSSPVNVIIESIV